MLFMRDCKFIHGYRFSEYLEALITALNHHYKSRFDSLCIGGEAVFMHYCNGYNLLTIIIVNTWEYFYQC